MISVSNDFKTALTLPRQKDGKVIVNGTTTLNSSQINSIQRVFKTDLFKSIIKETIIDSNVAVNKDDTIEPFMALYVDNDFEYMSLGSYKVIEAPNLNKDTKSYQISAYDEIVDSMIPYALTSGDITYPCTVKQLFTAIFTKLGWSLNGIPVSFTNSTSQIEQDVYSNMNMTYRDVLDELCTISCMFLVERDGIPKLIAPISTNETINEEFMQDVNVQIKNKVFFNSLVFARASDSDNIYRKDDESIADEGLHEFKVSNLQILSLNWRDNFIDAMWNYIKTFEYYSYDINTNGIGYLEPVDRFTLSIFSDTYSTLLLNDNLTIGNGINEKIQADEPVETQTEYKYASTTDKTINKTNLIVDKQNQQIQALVSSTKIISDTITANNQIQLSNAYKGNLHYLSIKGDIHLLTPSNTLYPSNDLTIKEPILLVDNVEYKLDIDYLNYINDEQCDEFIYEDGKCKIIRRVGVQQEEQREDIVINVNSNSTIRMKQFNNLTYKCSYLLQNDYTSTFANQVQTTSELNILSDSIEQKVSQVADENGNVTSASIILAVNNDNSMIKLQANKINMNGLVTANDNFKILEDGSMETKNAKFSGTISGGAIKVTGEFDENNPYIEVEDPVSTDANPIGTRIWANGITCYDYSNEHVSTIRTENSGGYAELYGSVVNAFGFNNVSLEEKKKNFEKLDNGLDIIKDIDIYKYNYKEEKDDDKKHIGLVIGDNYKYSKDITSSDNKEVDIYSFVSVCCKAIQELQKEIEDLKKEK